VLVDHLLELALCELGPTFDTCLDREEKARLEFEFIDRISMWRHSATLSIAWVDRQITAQERLKTIRVGEADSGCGCPIFSGRRLMPLRSNPVTVVGLFGTSYDKADTIRRRRQRRTSGRLG
jgi:hypothetical protein